MKVKWKLAKVNLAFRKPSKLSDRDKELRKNF
jgi:hypothetical protein